MLNTTTKQVLELMLTGTYTTTNQGWNTVINDKHNIPSMSFKLLEAATTAIRAAEREIATDEKYKKFGI